MTPRLILVPLSGTDTDRTALLTAHGVAARFDSHLEVLFVTPDPKDSVLVLGDGLSTLMVEDIMTASETAWQARAAVAKAAFEAVVREFGLRRVEGPDGGGGVTIRWRQRVGRADDEIIPEGQLADLLVFAHKPGHHDPRETQCLESALLYTGRPVLLAAKPQPTLGRNVAIAWNGRLEASRAVNAALPFLAAAEQVRILTLRTGDSAGDHGERLVQALAWRGIAAGVSVIEPEGSPPFAALTRRAAETGTDLLVMGAYGHSRVREMILGGATRYVLNHDGPAVLLAH